MTSQKWKDVWMFLGYAIACMVAVFAFVVGAQFVQRFIDSDSNKKCVDEIHYTSVPHAWTTTKQCSFPEQRSTVSREIGDGADNPVFVLHCTCPVPPLEVP